MQPRSEPFIKMCGLTSVGHLRAAEQLGASYVGLVVEVRRSPRSLSRAQARLMARAARVPPVLVTVRTEAEEVAGLVAAVRPAVVQLHAGGPELVGAVRRLISGVEVWYAVSVDVAASSAESGRFLAESQAARAAGADKVLVDSAKEGRSGGTGAALSWDLAAAMVEGMGDTPVILAGGLTPGNVAEAIRRVRPAGVDVSSGVEATPGVKSPVLMLRFCRSVSSVTEGGGEKTPDERNPGAG